MHISITRSMCRAMPTRLIHSIASCTIPINPCFRYSLMSSKYMGNIGGADNFCLQKSRMLAGGRQDWFIPVLAD